MNVLNGGSHAGGRLAFQEFMIVPSYVTPLSESTFFHCTELPVVGLPLSPKLCATAPRSTMCSSHWPRRSTDSVRRIPHT
jgi:hypothetical protein